MLKSTTTSLVLLLVVLQCAAGVYGHATHHRSRSLLQGKNSSPNRKGAKGPGLLNREDFKANGGALKALGASRLTRLAKRSKFAGSAEQLAHVLDSDGDLVSELIIEELLLL